MEFVLFEVATMPEHAIDGMKPFSHHCHDRPHGLLPPGQELLVEGLHIRLTPDGFFPRNPALDVPPSPEVAQ
jgi:hypothetical protein